MAKTIVPFGQSPTDKLVMQWLGVKMIDPNDVLGYRIARGNGDLPTIELTLHFSEEPAPAEKETSDG